MNDAEPWRRFAPKVDAENALPPIESARRAKIAYRAFMRSIARKSVKTRAAAKARRDAAAQRQMARQPTEREVAEFTRERREEIAALIIQAAAHRGEGGIVELRRHQLEVREDCALCLRPFSDDDRAQLPPGRRRSRRPLATSRGISAAKAGEPPSLPDPSGPA